MLILLTVAALVALLAIAGSIAWEAAHPARRTLAWALVHQLPADPGEMGLQYSEWMLEAPDPRRPGRAPAVLPVWDIALDAEPASRKPVLVVLHGWGRSRIDSLGRLRAILDAAPGAFGRAVLPELRGHGEASNSTSRLGDGEERDLLALLRRLDADRVLLAGHSLGATIAIRAAALHGATGEPRIVGVLAWAPYDQLATPLVNRLRASGSVARPFTDVALWMLRAAGVRRPRTDDAARSLAVPLLVIVGADDPVSPPEGARTIAAAAADGQCIVLPGRHPDVHLVDCEAHRRVVGEFIQRVTAAVEYRQAEEIRDVQRRHQAPAAP